MKKILICTLCLILPACKSLPLKGGLDILEDLGKAVAKAPNPTDLAKVTKAVPTPKLPAAQLPAAKLPTAQLPSAPLSTPRLPAAGLPSAGAVGVPSASLPSTPSLPLVAFPAGGGMVSTVNLRMVNTLPVSVRLQVLTPPRPLQKTRVRGVRPIRVSAPYTLSSPQQDFVRLGTEGLSRVNAAHPSARIPIMESVLDSLMKTPYILAQRAPIRHSLQNGSLTVRWSAMYSLYGYPVGVPYYYSETEHRHTRASADDEEEVYRSSEEAQQARILLLHLQLFLESIVNNLGLIHVRDGALYHGGTLVPVSGGEYSIHMPDGSGTIGITGKAIQFLAHKRLSIAGHNGINNIVLEPNLLRELPVRVQGDRLNLGDTTLQLNGVANLLIGPKAISVANIDHVDNHLVEKAISSALRSAGDQPLFKNF